MTKFSRNTGRIMTADQTQNMLDNWAKASPEERFKATQDRRYEYSGCDMYDEMSSLEGCVGIKMMDGMDDEGVHHFVRFPIDANGNILSRNSIDKDSKPQGYNFTQECPPRCDED